MHQVDIETERESQTDRIAPETTGLAECTSWQQLEAFIEQNGLKSANTVRGVDHAEHLLKKIDLVRQQICPPDVLPPLADLQTKVEELLQSEGKTAVSETSVAAYRTYLAQRHPNLELTEAEWENIVKKITPVVYSSIDLPLEEVTLKLNSLEGVATTASCAGHIEQNDPNQDLSDGYISLECTNTQLARNIQTNLLKINIPNVEVACSIVESENGQSKLRFGYQLYPSETWLERDNQTSIESIIDRHRQALTLFLKQEIPFSYDSDVGPVQNITFFRQQCEELFFDTPGGVDQDRIDSFYNLLPDPWSNEYRGYYTSTEALAQRDLVIAQVNSIIDQIT